MSDKEVNAINPNNNFENKSSTFNLVIGIATFLIALLGATFAYFSATARSEENDVTVKSAYVSISYDGGTEITATNLIPSSLTVALNKYKDKEVVVYDPAIHGEIITESQYDQYSTDDETMLKRRCVDAKGKEVCYVYQFSVESQAAEGEKTDIVGSIKINNNQFKNLSYILYEVNVRENEGVPVLDIFGFDVVDRYTLLDSHTEDGYFNDVDTNPDVGDNQNVKFGVFKQSPILNTEGETQEVIYPVACLFGNVDEIDAEGLKEDDTRRCRPLSITNNVKHTYQLVIWLEETGDIQEEQGLSFDGTVTIEVSGGVTTDEYSDGKITGTD